MASFKWALLGYRRAEVDAAVAAAEARCWALERDLGDAMEWRRVAAGALERAEGELGSLSAMVLEREREIRELGERLREAERRHERSIASLEAVSARLGEIEAQARGQATRIRMKALREAVEIGSGAAVHAANGNGAAHEAGSNGAGHEANGSAAGAPDGLFAGRVRLEVGPLGDFSQLVGIEEAIGRLGASQISVERFSEGRATLSLNLDEPVDLLRELEARSTLGFRVRRTSADDLVLDVDSGDAADGDSAADAGPEQRAA